MSSNSTAQKNVEELKKEAKWVDHNDQTLLQKKHFEMKEKLEADDFINKNWNYEPTEIVNEEMKDEDGEPGTSNPKRFNCSVIERYVDSVLYYSPPKRRVLICEDITGNQETKTPVYMDYFGNNKDAKDVPISNSLLFKYVNKNVINPEKEPILAEMVSETENNVENMIRCDCCSNGSHARCYEYENCPCFKANLYLQTKCEVVWNSATFEPIVPIEGKILQHEHFVFACSELCACGGRCNNNPLYFIEKNIFSFEMFGRSEILQYGVRCQQLIKRGAIAMEFTGELRTEGKKNKSEENENHWSIVVKQPEELFSYVLANRLDENSRLSELVCTHHLYEMYISAKEYGNLGRFLNHSCNPNLEPIRVFQKALTPAHLRFCLVAKRDIFPGEELTISYGPGYVKKFMRNRCFCGTFKCPSTRWKDMVGKDTKLFLQQVSEVQITKWKKLENVTIPRLLTVSKKPNGNGQMVAFAENSAAVSKGEKNRQSQFREEISRQVRELASAITNPLVTLVKGLVEIIEQLVQSQPPQPLATTIKEVPTTSSPLQEEGDEDDQIEPSSSTHARQQRKRKLQEGPSQPAHVVIPKKGKKSGPAQNLRGRVKGNTKVLRTVRRK